MIAIVLSMYLCMSLIFSVWTSWRESPVIVSLSHESMSIGQIPFPAVTVCPLTKSSINMFNYTAVYSAIFKLEHNKSRKITEKEYVLNISGKS